MEENSENTSPHAAAAGTSLANGSYSGGDSQTSSSNNNGSNGMTNSNSNNTTANGTYGANGARPNGSVPAANGASGTTAAGGVSTNGSATAANGAGAGNSTIGGKAGFNTATAKRSRLAGAPPPVYSPLGASSPSMSSNSPSFQTSTGSASSSTATTPSASPQSSNAHLPSTNSYSAPQQVQQQPQQVFSSQTAGSASSGSQMYPSLHLHPLNDTFIPKQISLYPPGPHNRIKIGRQTNAKTVPAPNNGYFDSKVLSRMHAEVWAEGNKVYIKDVKSSNGTFINGERLSPEAVESDIFELHNNDMVEFGIDITSEDAKTIVHHKVAARCFLVMNADDAVAASRNFANYYRDLGDSPMHRRPGMGPNKGGISTSGMNIDQVLSRLQTELQKSRETGADLGTLTNTIGEIHETLGGNLPVPPVPAYRVPPYVPGAANAPPLQQQASQQSQAQTQQLLTSLQTQLQETQNALNGHVERIRNLEGLLEEQERMRTELKEVKDRMEEARSEWERLREDRAHGNIDLADDDGDSDEKEDLQEHELDDDGTRTIRLDEDDIADLSRQGSHQVSLSQHPTRDADSRHQHDSTTSELTKDIAATQARLEAENETLSQRMQSLSNELSAAAQLSSSLKSQYSEAAETIRGLEEKVNNLEKALHTQRASEETTSGARSSPSVPTAEAESSKSDGRDDILREVESRFTNWKKSFEEAVQKEREGWEEEREQLRITLSEWEKRSESLKQSQSISSSGGRRKRRSKASTVGTSPEESSESQDDSQEEEGFVSPVTEEEAQPHDENDSSAADGVVQPKRPRSRRRNYRSGEAAKAARRAAAKAEAAQGSDKGKSPSKESGGQSLRRRQSWIPFSQSSVDKSGIDDLNSQDGGRAVGKKQQQRGRDASNVLEHPALPIVSVAGALVIGYLAYSAIIQQQK